MLFRAKFSKEKSNIITWRISLHKKFYFIWKVRWELINNFIIRQSNLFSVRWKYIIIWKNTALIFYLRLRFKNKLQFELLIWGTLICWHTLLLLVEYNCTLSTKDESTLSSILDNRAGYPDYHVLASRNEHAIHVRELDTPDWDLGCRMELHQAHLLPCFDVPHK